MPSTFSVKFYGCRGSIPVSGAAHLRYGGHTSCVSVHAGTRQLVLDAGSGAARLGTDMLLHARQLGQPVEAYFFFSHAHLDHILGLPYFAPLYMPDSTLWMFGPRNLRFDSFQATLDAIIAPPFFPVPRYEMASDWHFSDINQSETVYFVRDEPHPHQVKARHPHHQTRVPPQTSVEAQVECMHGLSHPKSGVNIYKITVEGRSLVYATDIEGYVEGDRRLLEFARGADVLVHDAMYTAERYTHPVAPTQGFGHSTVKIAADLARAAGVGQLVLFHHDPTNTDDVLDQLEAEAQSYFPASILAYDGLEILL